MKGLIQALIKLILFVMTTQCRHLENLVIGHFTVMDGSEADADLVLIPTFLLYYVNQVILMITSIFQGQFP